jgi:hypothetical protein
VPRNVEYFTYEYLQKNFISNLYVILRDVDQSAPAQTGINETAHESEPQRGCLLRGRKQTQRVTLPRGFVMSSWMMRLATSRRRDAWQEMIGRISSGSTTEWAQVQVNDDARLAAIPLLVREGQRRFQSRARSGGRVKRRQTWMSAFFLFPPQLPVIGPKHALVPHVIPVQISTIAPGVWR